MSNINAKINWITFHNEENYYSILACSDGTEKFSVICNIPNPIRGQEYSFNGEWGNHPKYGRQFKATDFALVTPTSENGIAKLLRSGLIKGIGAKTAEAIVEKFGISSLEIIENEPERLLEVRGIGKKNLNKIKAGWRDSQEIIKVQKFLQDCGVQLNAAKVYKQYGADSIPIIKKNPYILTEDLWGVSFRTADIIAKECGLAPDNPERIRAYVKYLLKRNSLAGHCYERASVLIARCSQDLSLNQPTIANEVALMARKGIGIVEDDGAIYLKSYYYAECGIGRKLYDIRQFEGNTVPVDIPKLEEEFSIRYDPSQESAIKGAVKNKVSVITGGPGTGKTTIIKAIVKAFLDDGKEVLLASPTGRAAKRMAEVVGMEAKTIHRLLEYNPMEGFTRNEENPLEADVIILDECSMIDVLLMHTLLKAVPEHMNLVMVGDVNQLPSVGPGNVLADVINSDCFYVAKLEKVFRQAEESDIVSNAHRINKGEDLILRGRDVFLVETNRIKEEVVKIAVKEKEVQVLSPMKKTDVGTIELNSAIQTAINPNPVLCERKYFQYKVGDRVMQIKNNYEKEVFNGSLGIVKGYDDGVLTVNFDGLYVQYDQTDIDEIMLAYAITIHKSQGSEFPVVAIPLTMQHRNMLQRNLIYTAFTRPSEKLYLVGDKAALDYAIRNLVAMERNTKLIQRLRGWCYESVS